MSKETFSFLTTIYGDQLPGLLAIWSKDTKKTKFFPDIESAVGYIENICKKQDVYFGTGLLKAQQKTGRGRAEDVVATPGVWLDVDIRGVTHKGSNLPATIKEGLDVIQGFPLKPSLIVHSGYGLHIYWLYKKPWKFKDGDRQRANKTSRDFQTAMIKLFREHGYEIDNTSDLSRVLRLPGTFNHKGEKPVKVKMFGKSNAKMIRYTRKQVRDATKSMQTGAKPKKCVKKNKGKKAVNEPQAKRILKNCSWFKHCLDDAATLFEFEWFDMLRTVAHCNNAEKWAIKMSNKYPEYSERETCDKLKRIINIGYRPPSCSTNRAKYEKYCGACEWRISSPVELGLVRTQPSLQEVGFELNNHGKVHKLNGNKFARHILTLHKMLYSDGDRYYLYDYAVGKWVYIEKNKLSRLLREVLHRFVPDFWTETIENNYIGALAREAPYCYQFNEKRDFLNLKNGMLNLQNFILEDHSPDFWSTVQLDINYNPEAECPTFKKFLNDIFEGDNERIRVIQEIMGLCLTTETSHQKLFIFYGTGANGKSLLCRVIESLCGEDNISALMINDLSNPFRRAELVDKLLNLSTENEALSKGGINTEILKQIASGDRINADVKYEKAFHFNPFCKLVFSTNNLPYTKDRSWGFYRRLLIVPFTKSFIEGSPEWENFDKLSSKLLSERDGILNFALGGLKRLRDNDFIFSNSESVNKALVDYQKIINPYLKFADEMLILGGNDDRIPNKRMLRAFQEWCVKKSHDKIGRGTPETIHREIRNAMGIMGISFIAGEKGKGGERFIRGVKFKA